MRELLLRDWRLYRATLILPLSFCVLWAFLPYLLLANEKEALPFSPAFVSLAAAAVMASLRVHGIHLLEVANGTLPDLAALPRSRGILGLLMGLVAGLIGALHLPRGAWSRGLEAAWTALGAHPWAQVAGLILLSALAIATSIQILRRGDL